MSAVTDFLSAMVGSSPIEWLAVTLGVINITLLIRRSIWNYPFGLVMVSLYAWIFFGAKLYGQVVLQPIYFGVQIYGLMHWIGQRNTSGQVIVRRLNKKQLLISIFGVLLGSIILGFLMEQYTDAAAPYWDGLLTALFIGAQFLLASRFVENWLFWIVGDLVAINLYWSQGLQPTSALYIVFLIFSVVGYFEWRRVLRAQS